MGNAVLGAVYAKGLKDEKRVKTFMSELLGKAVLESSVYQDRFEDTDCFIEGHAVSIKAQHTGTIYGNICFELAQHLTVHRDCSLTGSVLANRDIQQKDVDKLVASGSWESSWYTNGKADQYYILQGDTLKIYEKSDILAYVAANGFLRMRPLSFQRKSYQGGSYRYCNAICGYLPTNAVKNVTLSIPNEYET
jgi:hypothetical protein